MIGNGVLRELLLLLVLAALTSPLTLVHLVLELLDAVTPAWGWLRWRA